MIGYLMLPILITIVPDKGPLVILLVVTALALLVVFIFAAVLPSKLRHSAAFDGSPGVYTGGSYSPRRRQVFTKAPALGARRR